MDKLEQYRQHIKQLLSDYAGYFKVTEDMETEIVSTPIATLFGRPYRLGKQ